MQRPIKFRAWSKEHNEMWGVAYLSWVIDIAYDEPERNISSDVQMFGATNGKAVSKVGYNPAKNIVLMQYTGLKDKNGTDVYEGDIIRLNDSEILRTVEFDKGCFVAANRRGGSVSYRELWEQTLPEVIGNVHENPELLKTRED